MSCKVINNENFSEIMKNNNLVVLDFWASWCQPCKMISPIINSLSNKEKEVFFGKINIDENPALATQFRIDSIPTLLFLKNGMLLDSITGYADEETIMKIIRTNK